MCTLSSGVEKDEVSITMFYNNVNKVEFWSQHFIPNVEKCLFHKKNKAL
jgi:hypothetical protein